MLLHDLDLGGQGAGAQHIDETLGLNRVEAAGDLGAPVGDGHLNVRRRVERPVHDDRQLAVDVGRRHAGKDLGALGREGQSDGGSTVVVGFGTGILEMAAFQFPITQHKEGA